MKKRNAIQELKYLYTWEMIATCFFWLDYAVWKFIGITIGYSITYALICLTLILVEGSFYWWNCYRTVVRKKSLKSVHIAPAYRFFKYFNQAVLVIFIPVCLIFRESTGQNIFAVLIWLFAIIEQINYYYVRLSYYSRSGMGLQLIQPFKNLLTGKAKKSQIAKDIEKHYRI